MSIMEAEHIAVMDAVKEALWLRGLVGDLGLVHEHMEVHRDRQRAIRKIDGLLIMGWSTRL